MTREHLPNRSSLHGSVYKLVHADSLAFAEGRDNLVLYALRSLDKGAHDLERHELIRGKRKGHGDSLSYPGFRAQIIPFLPLRFLKIGNV